MKKQVMVIILSLLFSFLYMGNAKAEDAANKAEKWWLEIGSDIGYQRTNAWYTTQRDFGISILDTRGGYRFKVFGLPYLFLDPYIHLELKGDLGDKEQNKFFWNNYLRYGPGVRLRAEKKEVSTPNKVYDFRVNYANLDYFVEYAGISFIDRGQTIPGNIPRNDLKTGFNTWISADNNVNLSGGRLYGGAWFEMWGDLTYHSTNFFEDGENNFYILTLSPKVGLRIAYDGVGLEPYLRLDYVRDLGNEDWSKEAWGNNSKYGGGVRLSLGGLTKRTDTSIYLYAEYVRIDYDTRVGWKSAGLSNDDFRVGINLWLPFGASKGSQGARR